MPCRLKFISSTVQHCKRWNYLLQPYQYCSVPFHSLDVSVNGISVLKSQKCFVKNSMYCHRSATNDRIDYYCNRDFYNTKRIGHKSVSNNGPKMLSLYIYIYTYIRSYYEIIVIKLKITRPPRLPLIAFLTFLDTVAITI